MDLAAVRSPRFLTTVLTGDHGRLVVLLDYRFWSQHEVELDQWCQEHAVTREGMTVTMPEDVLTLFTLRWQS